ncbi:hypothetical protein ACFX13_013189 [Malus domestica]
MIRTRLVWFGVGFSLTGAAISHLVWKDLLVDRFALSSDVKQKFDALEGRLVNLERSLSPDPNHNPAQEKSSGGLNSGDWRHMNFSWVLVFIKAPSIGVFIL